MKTRLIIPVALAALALHACSSSDTDVSDLSQYKEWRAQNDAWVASLMKKTNPDGSPYYITRVPDWNPGNFVLMHYFNDTTLTAGNYVPMYTSVVDVIYEGYTCLDSIFDSSKNVNTYGRSGVQRFACNRTIQGWGIALENMHVGDTCEVIVPYQAGYGATVTSSLKPYTSMRFNMRLVDIYSYY